MCISTVHILSCLCRTIAFGRPCLVVGDDLRLDLSDAREDFFLPAFLAVKDGISPHGLDESVWAGSTSAAIAAEHYQRYNSHNYDESSLQQQVLAKVTNKIMRDSPDELPADKQGDEEENTAEEAERRKREEELALYSCERKCGQSTSMCWCDDLCHHTQDCCHDITTYCNFPSGDNTIKPPFLPSAPASSKTDDLSKPKAATFFASFTTVPPSLASSQVETVSPTSSPTVDPLYLEYLEYLQKYSSSSSSSSTSVFQRSFSAPLSPSHTATPAPTLTPATTSSDSGDNDSDSLTVCDGMCGSRAPIMILAQQATTTGGHQVCFCDAGCQLNGDCCPDFRNSCPHLVASDAETTAEVSGR